MRRLLVRPGAIGDFIVAIPAMQHLRADYTEVWTSAATVPLANFADGAQSITDAGLNRLGITEADDVIAKLRGFDSIVSWYGTNRPEFRALTEALQLPFTFHPALPAGECLHATDFFLRQAGAEPGAIPRLDVPPTGRGDFAVIHPFSGSERKNWPMERFAALAGRLQNSMPVQWCRGPEDTLADAVCLPNLYDLACWLSQARVFIGNDSGVTHLAAAVGTPVVAVFRAANRPVWAPRGDHVRIVEGVEVTDISVDDLARAAEQALG